MPLEVVTNTDDPITPQKVVQTLLGFHLCNGWMDSSPCTQKLTSRLTGRARAYQRDSKIRPRADPRGITTFLTTRREALPGPPKMDYKTPQVANVCELSTDAS